MPDTCSIVLNGLARASREYRDAVQARDAARIDTHPSHDVMRRACLQTSTALTTADLALGTALALAKQWEVE